MPFVNSVSFKSARIGQRQSFGTTSFKMEDTLGTELNASQAYSTKSSIASRSLSNISKAIAIRRSDISSKSNKFNETMPQSTLSCLAWRD